MVRHRSDQGGARAHHRQSLPDRRPRHRSHPPPLQPRQQGGLRDAQHGRRRVVGAVDQPHCVAQAGARSEEHLCCHRPTGRRAARFRSTGRRLLLQWAQRHAQRGYLLGRPRCNVAARRRGVREPDTSAQRLVGCVHGRRVPGDKVCARWPTRTRHAHARPWRLPDQRGGSQPCDRDLARRRRDLDGRQPDPCHVILLRRLDHHRRGFGAHLGAFDHQRRASEPDRVGRKAGWRHSRCPVRSHGLPGCVRL